MHSAIKYTGNTGIPQRREGRLERCRGKLSTDESEILLLVQNLCATDSLTTSSGTTWVYVRGQTFHELARDLRTASRYHTHAGAYSRGISTKMNASNHDRGEATLGEDFDKALSPAKFRSAFIQDASPVAIATQHGHRPQSHQRTPCHLLLPGK